LKIIENKFGGLKNPPYICILNNNTMFKRQLFQLIDYYSEQIGLIYTPDTTIKENAVEDKWKEFCNSFHPDADDFVEWLNDNLNPSEEFPNGIYFERVFASETFA
jgi:hypothetical protein